MKIKQLIPAEGWSAVSIDLEEETYRIEPLAAWALCEPAAGLQDYAKEDASEQVAGLIADRCAEVYDVMPSIRAPGETYGFFEYVHQSTLNDSEKWSEVVGRVQGYIKKALAEWEVEA